MNLITKRVLVILLFHLFTTLFVVLNVKAVHGPSKCPTTRSEFSFTGFVLSTDPSDYNYWVPDGWFQGAESYSNVKRPVSVSFSDSHAHGGHTWYQMSFVVDGVTYYEYGFRTNLDCDDETQVIITPPSGYTCDKTFWMIINPRNYDILGVGNGCTSGEVIWRRQDNSRKVVFNMTTSPIYSCSFNDDGTVDIAIAWNWTTWADFFSTRLDENPDSFSGDCDALNPGDECRDVNNYWTVFENKQPNTTYKFWVHPRFDQEPGEWRLVMRRDDIICYAPTSTPTPTPTAAAWIKVKNAPFAEIESSSTISFNNNLPSTVEAVDSDDNDTRAVSFVDSPRSNNYKKHGVATIKNNVANSTNAGNNLVVDEGVFIKNYGNLALNKFSSFNEFLEYVKKFKEYRTLNIFSSSRLNEMNNGDIVVYDPAGDPNSSVNISSIFDLDKDLVLIVNRRVVINSNNFNVNTTDDSIKENLVLISNEIEVGGSITKLYGVYLADTVTIANSSTPLKVKGLLSAFSEFNQDKTLITPSNRYPALFLVYDIKPILYHLKALSFFTIQRR